MGLGVADAAAVGVLDSDGPSLRTVLTPGAGFGLMAVAEGILATLIGISLERGKKC